jgi:preflagellin peptidase FlaK
MSAILETTRVVISLIFLFYASWSDYKTREVSNKVWIFYAPVAFVLLIGDILFFEPSKFVSFGICLGLTVAFSLLLFYSGMFGGADSKALMCIAIALPFFPQTSITPLIKQGISPISQHVFPLTILSNAVLFAAFIVVCMLARNIYSAKKTRKHLFEGALSKESVGKKILVLLTGYKMPISKLEEKWHIYPLEDFEKSGEQETRKLVIVPREEGRDAIVKHLSTAVEEGKITDGVWATPGLPMLIFITAGLMIALVLGDIVWLIVSSILG